MPEPQRGMPGLLKETGRIVSYETAGHHRRRCRPRVSPGTAPVCRAQRPGE